MGLFLGLFIADQFFRNYRAHHIELLSSYGHDALAAPVWWLGTQGVFPRIEFFKSRKNIFLATALCVAFEASEYLTKDAPDISIPGLGIGRYDPYDFVAYGVGTLTALGLHRAMYGRRTPQNPT